MKSFNEYDDADDKKLTLSPVEVLRHKYIIPCGLSVKQYAKRLGVNYTNLWDILKGKCKMSAIFIEKIAKFTNTKIEFWHDLQINYEFKKYKELASHREIITPITRKLSLLEKLGHNSFNGTPGNFLLKNYLEPNKHTIFRASVELKINRLTLEKLITGKYRIDHIIAGKLSKTLQTKAMFWFQLQTANDITKYLASKRKLTETFQDQIISYRDHLLNRELMIESKCVHPGILLNKSIVASSKMKIINWCNIFCVSKMILKPILMGRKEMPLSMIIKLCHLIKSPINYWLDMQIQYYSKLAQLTVVESPNRTFRQSNAKLNPRETVFSPGEVLKNYLDTLNWSLKDFSEHIRISKNRVDHLRQGNVIIDFDLACRLGQALDKDPMYWIKLQLEDSLKHSKHLPIR